MNKSKTIIYTESITRMFTLTTGEKDSEKVVRGLRDKTLFYVYDNDDRSKGAIVDDGGQTIALTTQDYGLVMRRDNFRTEVDWPDTGFLAWVWNNQNLHCWFTRGFLFMGWVFCLAMCFFGHKEYAGHYGVAVLVALSLPMVAQTVLLSCITLKRNKLGV